MASLTSAKVIPIVGRSDPFQFELSTLGMTRPGRGPSAGTELGL